MASNPWAERFKALMALLPESIKKEIQAELEKQAFALVDLAKRAVPVKSGKLRDSIRAERPRNRQLSVLVKAGGPTTTRPVRKGETAQYDYAAAQEWGTVNTGAQPFFYPSYRLKKKDVEKGVKKAVNKVVKAVPGNGA